MSTLKDLLSSKSKRLQVIEDCVKLVHSEVASKSGLSGLAIKAAFAIVQKIKPDIVHEAVDKLLDAFVAQLEPFYSQAQSAKQNISTYLTTHADAVTTALLEITDNRIAKVENRSIKAAYEKLRPTAVKHVVAAVPGIARILQKHATSPA